MGYADLTAAKAQLILSDTDTGDANRIVLLGECDDAVSLAFEAKAGFDVTYSPIWRGADDTTVVPTARRVWGDYWYTDVLMLPDPAISVSDVQIGGVAPEVLTVDDWMVWAGSPLGPSRQLRRIDGGLWPRRTGQTYITVTALWADGPRAEDPPIAVVNACTFLAVEEYRMRSMSPAGEVGPDGLSIRPRNPWNYTVVQVALDAVRPAAPMPVF